MEETLNDLYRLFAKYPAERPLDICTECCMPVQNEALLATTDVRIISKGLLQEYNDGASTERTHINEIKHFLPRYLDLISQFLFPSHSTELALRRLSHNTIEWKPAELLLLQDFAVEYFDKCLLTYPLPHYEQIDIILIMLWHPQFQPMNLLAHWLSNSSKESLLHYRDLIFDGFRKNNSGKMRNPFANPTITHSLKQWINHKETQNHFSAIIERAIVFNEISAETDLQELNILHDILVHNRNCV